MKRFGSIYKITDKDGKSYIGQTTRENYLERVKDHMYRPSSKMYIDLAMRKHGFNAFKVEELAIAFTLDDLNFLERYFIESLGTQWPNGYNLTSGGKHYGSHSEATKKKISESKIGKTPNRVYTFSKEQRLKISKALGGKGIIATNLTTGEVKEYETSHSTKIDGFQPWNVISVCKNKRKHHKGWKFQYKLAS